MQFYSEKNKISIMIQKEENYKSFYSNEVTGGSSDTINFNSYNIIQNNDNHYYSKIENINNLIDEIYPKFRENFELTNYLSYGSTGIVYEGKLKKGNINQKLAFKFKINPKNKSDKSREITISKKLHHKNITQIYGYIKMNDTSFFSIVELGEHGDLDNFQKKILKQRILSETIICYFAKQILEALDFIHKCKIIHMDIKQGNIVVDSNLDIKLTDFSVSFFYYPLHPEDIIKFPYVGTSKYMSPEIIERTHMKIEEGHKIDIYSLGVTLYNIAFETFPYKLDEVGCKDNENILKNIKSENLEFPEDRNVSNLFINFLEGLLEKDYTKRFNIKQALNHPWIKGSKFIFDEKEKSFCYDNFLINLITDNIDDFNNYIKNND